ncbi:MAG: hypothetical protein JW891_01475 [Candidatus Lokiarchaeota archaeon]|nr:hypothetical protein [Candidatus Lokiarchaeota archaeon]
MLENKLIHLIDKAVSQDFTIHEITDQDLSNDSYKALKFTLSFNKIHIKYERKVETNKYPIIPQFQYLFGFDPNEGVCLFVDKEIHKNTLCDGPLEEINSTCSLIHSLMYLLVPIGKFEVYSYLPTCCELNCPNSPKQYDLRIKLFES